MGKFTDLIDIDPESSTSADAEHERETLNNFDVVEAQS